MNFSFVGVLIASVLLFVSSSSVVRADDSLVFPPLDGKTGGNDELLVFIPGANVPTDNYNLTATAIQNATNLKLWVVVPAMPAKTCITTCPSTSLCSPLQALVTRAVGFAKDKGFKGTMPYYLAGHSLGGVCSATLGAAYANTKESYKALVVMGAYVTDQDVFNYKLPVLTLGAELDGGLGRPGMLSKSLLSSDSWASSNGGIDGQAQLTSKPVVILPGLDHSSFCPGFKVPGDVFPADVDPKYAGNLIGPQVAAFLHLHSDQSEDVVKAAVQVLKDGSKYTRNGILGSFREAQTLEIDSSKTSSPWCAYAQMNIPGIKSKQDLSRLVVGEAVYKDKSSDFEHTRVHYETLSDGNLEVNVSGHNSYYSGITESCLVPALEIGCKLASADRIAEQMNLTKDAYNDKLTCMDINKLAYAKALDILEKNGVAGQKTLDRFHKRGRPVCFSKDTHPLGNIGPLFINGHMSIKDNGTCLEIASLALGPQPLNSKIFPGVHYCKLLSPARVIDYIMTDSLKPKSGCLNV